MKPLTVGDYDRAIRDLGDARAQTAIGDFARGCAYCGSEEHAPDYCPHNVLAIARNAEELIASAKSLWRCFHCGETFSAKEEDAAKEHFGLNASIPPQCIREALKKAGIGFGLDVQEDGSRMYVLWMLRDSE